MDRIRMTWLGEFKSVIFLVLGIIAVFRIPNMMPFLTFLFIILFGMIVIFRLGEVYLLKKKENKRGNLIAAAINMAFVIWSVYEIIKYSNESSRQFADNVVIIISTWIALLVIWGTIEGIILLVQKNIVGNLILSEAILSTLLWFFFYRVTLTIREGEPSERVLINFGIFCISLAIISFLHTRVVKYLVKKQEVAL